MKIWHRMLAVLMLMVLAVSCAAAMEYPEGTLYRGIYGYHDEIEFLQYQLFYAGYLGDDISAVDGIFGAMTENAVKQYQKDHGIDVTGIVCPNTVTALDREWEEGMEPQGGEEYAEEAYPYCYIEYYANDAKLPVLCSKHKDVSAQVTAAVMNAQENDEQTMEALQTGITLWLDEIENSYQLWMQLRPEYAQLIENHQATFMEYYRAQLAVWNAHFGSPSMAALEKAMEMLADQCSYLCITLSGAI